MGRLGQNSCPRDRNFTLNGVQGEVGASLKKNKIKETHFHSVTTQTQAINGAQGEVEASLKKKKKETHSHSVTTQAQAVLTIYYRCIVFLNGNSMCNG